MKEKRAYQNEEYRQAKPLAQDIQPIIDLAKCAEYLSEYISRFNDLPTGVQIKGNRRKIIEIAYRAAREKDEESLLKLKTFTSRLEEIANRLDKEYPFRASPRIRPSEPYLKQTICLGEYAELLALYIVRFNDPSGEIDTKGDNLGLLVLIHELEFSAARFGDQGSILELKVLIRELDKSAALLDKTYPLRASSRKLREWRTSMQERKENTLTGELFL